MFSETEAVLGPHRVLKFNDSVITGKNVPKKKETRTYLGRKRFVMPRVTVLLKGRFFTQSGSPL